MTVMITNQKLARRYRSAYWAGKLINALGIFIVLTGIILALLLAGLTIRTIDIVDQHPSTLDWVRDNLKIGISGRTVSEIIASIGLVFTLLTFLVLWLVGTFVSAAAQRHKALIDTAVNTSPFLSIEEKQKVIR